MDTNTLIALSGTVTTLLLGILSFFTRMWMKRIDDAIRLLTTKIQRLEISEAVANEKEAAVRGSLDMLRGSIDATNGNVGKLSSSIEKLWEVTTRNYDVRRSSDGITKS